MSLRARLVMLVVVMLTTLGLQGVGSAQPLHQFVGTDGEGPTGELVQGRDGFLYGWTSGGGAFGEGTLFRIAPDGTGFRTLHSFAGNAAIPDGANPGKGALVEGAAGVFYGTTNYGGFFGLGALFKLDMTGPAPAITTLYSFSSAEAVPNGGVIIGSDGALYGTTYGGGNGYGTVFRVGKDGQGFTVIHTFFGTFINGEGIRPLATVIEVSDGWLYGTTSQGAGGNVGTVFRMLKDGSVFQTIAAALPGVSEAALIEVSGPSGPRLYGVTRADTVPPSYGSIFRVALDGSSLESLWDFPVAQAQQPMSYSPMGRLLRGRDGNLYGTTSLPDDPSCPSVGCGSIFRLKAGAPQATPPFTLRGFQGTDGERPFGGLIQGADGHLYGTTIGGGADGRGVVFVVRDPASAPVVLTGPAVADDGASTAYELTLRNQTGIPISGPFVVSLAVSPGLTQTGVPPSVEWTCAPTAAGYTCEWTPPTVPAALAPGASSETLTLQFAVGSAPFAPDCGLGPSPCAKITATLAGLGGAATVTATVRTRHPTTGGWNQPPQAVDDLAHVDGANGITIAVLANDTDPDGDPLSVTGIVVQPVFGTATINTDGTVSYSPFSTLTEPDTFRYRVADNQGASVVGLVRVFPLPGQPGLGRARIDLGVVAVGRLAAGRITVTDTAGLGGTVTFRQITSPFEILAALAGTGYDPSRVVSDPGDFRSAGWPSQLPPADPEALLYFRPSSTDVGRVSVVRAVFEFTGTSGTAPASLVIIGASADPAAAPPRAGDDVASTPLGTPVEIAVSANDQGPSGGPVFPAFIEPACVNLEQTLFDGEACVAPVGGTASLVLRDSGAGLRPAAIAFTPQDGFVGVQRFFYGSSDVNPCGGALPCDSADNLYFAAVDVAVNGSGDDSVRGTIGGVVGIRYDILLANDAPGLSFAGLVGSTFGPTHWVQDRPDVGLLSFNHFGTTSAETISFTYEAVDSAGRRYPATVRVVVDNRVPTAVDVALPVIPGQTLEVLWESIVSAPGNVDPDGDPITLAAYELIDASPFGVFEGFGTAAGLGGFRFTPAPTYTGGYAFRYGLRDLADLRGADYDGHGAIGYGTLTFPVAAAAPPVRVEAALSWTRVAGPGPLAVGDVVRLAGRVTNSSSGTAHAPAARFALPAEMGTTGFTEPGWIQPWTCSASPALTNGSAGTPGVVVTCTGPDLAPGDSPEIVVFARILAAPAGGALEPAFAAGNTDCDATQTAGIPVCSSVTTSITVMPNATARIGARGAQGASVEVLLGTSVGQFRAAHGQPLAVFQGTPPPPGVSLPYGVMSFEITGVPVGGTAVVRLQTPSPVTGYWKYQGNTWTAFPGAVPVPGGVELTLVDGGAGDDDGMANGVVVDPGGPVEIAGPPTADAGPDRVVEASSSAGAVVTLTGAGADPDGGPVTFTWSGACGSASGEVVALTCPPGTSVVTLMVTDATGLTATDTVTVTVTPPAGDKTPPAIACEAADAAWRPGNAVVACTAEDTGSGLANPADASFTLETAVGAGTESAAAFTGTRVVCDAAGNCATAGPVGPFRVDRQAPVVSLIAPADGAIYVLNQAVPASFTCSDGGSGVATCTGTAANASALDTASIGTKTFAVTATDAAGNQTSVTRTYTVQFAAPGPCFVSMGHTILPPIAPNGSSVFKRGLPVPARFRACDAAGRPVSAPAVVTSFKIIEKRIGPFVEQQVRDVPSVLTPARFRWDPLLRDWFYLVDTRGLQAGATYTFRITLTDRTTIDFRFAVK